MGGPVKDTSIKDFAAKLREEYDMSGDSRSDEQLVSDYLKKHPEDLDEIRRSNPRPQEGMISKFAKGAIAAPSDTVVGPYKAGAESSQDPKQMLKFLGKNFSTPIPFGPSMLDLLNQPKTGEQAKQKLLGIVDLPNISGDIEKGNWAGASGRSLTQAMLIASMFAGMVGKKPMTGPQAMEEMGNIGKGLKVSEANLDAAKAATNVPSKFLSAEIDAMRDGLKGQWVDVKGLRQALAKPTKIIADIDRAPGMQVKDITAAKDVVARLNDRMKKGMLSWPEAQGYLKELRAAAANTRGASQLRTYLNETADTLETSVVDSAQKGGYGPAYKKWQQNYRDLSRLQRAHAKITAQTTQSQLEAGATKGPGIGIPRTGLRIGGRGVQKAGKTQLKNWNIALKELNKRIGVPKGATGPKPPAPGGGQVPPAGGAAPPPGGAAPPPVSGGSGTYVRPPVQPGAGTAAQGVEETGLTKEIIDLAKGKVAAPPNPFDAPAYQNAPKAVSREGIGQGGANYTAEDLAKLKQARGIKDDF